MLGTTLQLMVRLSRNKHETNTSGPPAQMLAKNKKRKENKQKSAIPEREKYCATYKEAVEQLREGREEGAGKVRAHELGGDAHKVAGVLNELGVVLGHSLLSVLLVLGIRSLARRLARHEVGKNHAPRLGNCSRNRQKRNPPVRHKRSGEREQQSKSEWGKQNAGIANSQANGLQK